VAFVPHVVLVIVACMIVAFMIVFSEHFAFHGLEGGFNVGVGGIFDGFCGTQDCAFQIACASVPARISLAKTFLPSKCVPEMGREVRETRFAGKGRSTSW